MNCFSCTYSVHLTRPSAGLVSSDTAEPGTSCNTYARSRCTRLTHHACHSCILVWELKNVSYPCFTCVNTSLVHTASGAWSACSHQAGVNRRFCASDVTLTSPLLKGTLTRDCMRALIVPTEASDLRFCVSEDSVSRFNRVPGALSAFTRPAVHVCVLL